jgi:hypothetical protein
MSTTLAPFNSPHTARIDGSSIHLHTGIPAEAS